MVDLLLFQLHTSVVRFASSGDVRRFYCRCLISCLGISLLTGCMQKPVTETVTMKIGHYALVGPVRDSDSPSLTFPAIDLFSPNGKFAYHAHSLDDLMHYLENKPIPDVSVQNRRIDTLDDIATRYPELALRPEKLHGRYTLVFVSAPQCHACESQEQRLRQVKLSDMGINEVFLTLNL